MVDLAPEGQVQGFTARSRFLYQEEWRRDDEEKMEKPRWVAGMQPMLLQYKPAFRHNASSWTPYIASMKALEDHITSPASMQQQAL